MSAERKGRFVWTFKVGESFEIAGCKVTLVRKKGGDYILVSFEGGDPGVLVKIDKKPKIKGGA